MSTFQIIYPVLAGIKSFEVQENMPGNKPTGQQPLRGWLPSGQQPRAVQEPRFAQEPPRHLRLSFSRFHAISFLSSWPPPLPHLLSIYPTAIEPDP